MKITQVTKSDGRVVPFDFGKIERSVILAGKDTKVYGPKQARKILKRIAKNLAGIKQTQISSKVIREIVEPAMAEEGYFKTARYYILFGERKSHEEYAGKPSEPEMVENARLTLVSRCSKTTVTGKTLETPGEIFWRVAKHMAKAEINWGDEKEVKRVAREFYNRMASFKLVCTRSALYEAGNEACAGQLSPCFVLPIEDSIPVIFDTLGKAAIVQKNFGGTGFNFSKIRMKGDKVHGVPNVASGPVDFLQVYSGALEKVVQGGKRHGGNMGILNVSHPDIDDFMRVKDSDGSMKNFNISVGVTDEFMEAVAANKSFNLINPRDGKKVKQVKAKRLFGEICKHAWLTGDPGMIFLDRMEEDNFTPSLGRLDATNPCGEQPLLPYESCNLSSVNLAAHLVKGKEGRWEMDWNSLGETVATTVRFLDDMIETNTYVLQETEQLVRYGNRKIGVGVIGLGEVFFKLSISYAGKEAVALAEKIAKFVRRSAESASAELAKTRGVFPNFDISTFTGTPERYRNCTMVTIAPTGTVSMIANTTSGIEPSFALVYRRNSFYNEDEKNQSTKALFYVEPYFEELLKERGLYSEELIEKINENHGSLFGLKEIPEEIRKVFVVAHDIAPEWHVKIQAAFQKYCDNSVSKTINFAKKATVEEVEKAYLLAWKLRCKGITVYRDGSKADQVLVTGTVEEEVCPECNGVMVFEGGCSTCRDCGYSKCKV